MNIYLSLYGSDALDIFADVSVSALFTSSFIYSLIHSFIHSIHTLADIEAARLSWHWIVQQGRLTTIPK